MKQTMFTILLLLAVSTGAATIENNASCDIAVMPAATLLLPYFEVDVNSPQDAALTTLFTVINTSRSPQIARVTLWTDLGYPVTNFNLFLTGYDMQSINLYDVLARGFVVSQSGGTTSATEPGGRSLDNDDNPNFVPATIASCASNPGPIPAAAINDIRNALTLGAISGCGKGIGLVHANAIGYATIDVVRTCGLSFPTEASYWDELLNDNVLTGDYQTINPEPATGNYASGNTLVHIRAVPGLPYTFYDRYTPRSNPGVDRRQPLPSAFVARFIEGETGAFHTTFQIWREGITGANAACSDYVQNDGSAMTVLDFVRFDDQENPTTLARACIETSSCRRNAPFPETSSTPTSRDVFPPLLDIVDPFGWMYLNLNHSESSAFSRSRASQNWVTVTMFAEGRFSTAFDATALGNGCNLPRPANATIGPAP